MAYVPNQRQRIFFDLRDFCLRNESKLTDWELRFCKNMIHEYDPTMRQFNCMHHIAESVKRKLYLD